MNIKIKAAFAPEGKGRKHIASFLHREKGGLAVIFAIILPFILSLCALAFDGARLITKKARLADALNEAALAIATTSTASPTAEEKIKLKLMLSHYVNAYLPDDTIRESSIDVTYFTDPETNMPLPVFSLNAKIAVDTLLPLSLVPSFEATLDMANKGKVRKGIQDLGRAADYIFVVDFSGSMSSPSAEPGLTRLQLLKKVVKNITNAALDAHPETTFGIVPFEYGVPMKYPIKEKKILPGGEEIELTYSQENEMGGVVSGCSVLIVPKKMEHPHIKDKYGNPLPIGYDINYAFWANKSYLINQLPEISASATSMPFTMDEVNRVLNYGRYMYFKNWVLPSAGGSFDAPPVTDWCTRNADVPINSTTHAPYTCEKKPTDPLVKDLNIFTAESQEIIEAEIARARNVFRYGGGYFGTLFNGSIVDSQATMDGMFDAENIINFPKYYGAWGSGEYYGNPFPHMCLSSGSDMLFYGSNRNKLAELKNIAYLIEPTNDRKKLDEFQDMRAEGGTASTTGLLRAVPELIKGTNPRKVIIVVSDGEDSDSFKDQFHRPNKGLSICDRIRQYTPLYSPGTEEVEIYFINVVKDSGSRTKYWGDYCTGPENAMDATNYESIMNKLVEIMNKYEETGYFYN